MLLPGPDHPITIVREPNIVRVVFNGTVIAETSRALRVIEASYRPVLYLSREDARMEYFTQTDHQTSCPYKGKASYFTLEVGGKRSENAAWSYETPFAAVAEIAGALAFYPQRVDFIEIE